MNELDIHFFTISDKGEVFLDGAKVKCVETYKVESPVAGTTELTIKLLVKIGGIGTA